MSVGYRVGPIDPQEHAAFVAAEPSVSYLHTPQWSSMKEPDQAEALGIWRDDELVGVGLVQYLRRFAGKKGAYFPDGPHVRWADVDPAQVLAALEQWLAAHDCFEVRVGPFVTWHTWSNEAMKEVLGHDADTDLRQVPPSTTDPTLSALDVAFQRRGWRVAAEADTDDGQNSYNFFVDVDRPAEQILASMNQMYRRNIKKAQKAGVVVRQGGAADLPTFHDLYRASGEREGFYVQPLEYFQRQFAAFDDSRDHVRVFVAELDGEPLAGSVWVKVGGHVWYTRGGSSDSHRDARAVNLLQWAMIEAAHDAGATVYDMGGVYPWINESSRGLLQFKVGTGGYVSGSMRERTRTLDPVVGRAADVVQGARRRVRTSLPALRRVVGRVRSLRGVAGQAAPLARGALARVRALVGRAG